MDMDSTISADIKEQLQVEETDDSCRLDFIEIVPLARDTDGSRTTECVSGDCCARAKQENLAVMKQEPDDVCFTCRIQFIRAKRYVQIFGVRLLFWSQCSYSIIVIVILWYGHGAGNTVEENSSVFCLIRMR